MVARERSSQAVEIAGNHLEWYSNVLIWRVVGHLKISIISSFLRIPDLERFPQDLPIRKILWWFLAGAVSAGHPDSSAG